jgi:hypothetical protein
MEKTVSLKVERPIGEIRSKVVDYKSVYSVELNLPQNNTKQADLGTVSNIRHNLEIPEPRIIAERIVIQLGDRPRDKAGFELPISYFRLLRRDEITMQEGEEKNNLSRARERTCKRQC